MLKELLSVELKDFSRPTGRPKSIVAPAMKPRSTTVAKCMHTPNDEVRESPNGLYRTIFVRFCQELIRMKSRRAHEEGYGAGR